MVLQLHMSTTQQKAPVHNMDQNGSNNSQRIPNVNPSPRISRLADKLQSKVCSFPAKELQVLGRDGPFHRERTEPLGTTQVPCITMIALSLLTAAPQQFNVLDLSSTAALISWHACSLQPAASDGSAGREATDAAGGHPRGCRDEGLHISCT